MKDHHSVGRKHLLPPAAANKILNYLLSDYAKEALIGDLCEEFDHRSQQHGLGASLWYWQQTLRTIMLCCSQKLCSPAFLKSLAIFICATGTGTLVCIIAWLSYLDNAEEIPTLWPLLLQGKVHSFLFNMEFWSLLPKVASRVDSISMLIHIPSIIWAGFSLVLLKVLQVKRHMSGHQIAAWGYGLMLLPYVMGLLDIEFNQYMPQQIGPILALMLISVLYMLLPVTYMVVRRLNEEIQ